MLTKEFHLRQVLMLLHINNTNTNSGCDSKKSSLAGKLPALAVASMSSNDTYNKPWVKARVAGV